MHQSLHDEFVARFTKAVDALELGMPWDEGVSITHLPEMGRVQYMQELLADSSIHS